MKRERNIDSETAERIVELLDGWSGKLTWERLIKTVKSRLKRDYSRQALYRHENIYQAYTVRKELLAGQPRAKSISVEAPELQLALARIAQIEGENQRLRMENADLREQFVLWVYNARTRNLDEAFLSQPLPSVDREASEKANPQKLGVARPPRKG